MANNSERNLARLLRGVQDVDLRLISIISASVWSGNVSTYSHADFLFRNNITWRHYVRNNYGTLVS